LKYLQKYPVTSLLVLALLSGVIWRLEVEYQGWAGLTWLSYFHIAIVFGFGLFLFWANSLVNIQVGKRIAMNILAIGFGVFIYVELGYSFAYRLQGGPSGLIREMLTPEWISSIYRQGMYVLIPLIPIGAFLILYAFGIKKSIKYLTFSVLSMLVSIPISIFILTIFNHKGGSDFIHSIKSGVLIPFWMVSVGLVFLESGRLYVVGENTNHEQ